MSSDAELVARMSEGDESALGELHTKWFTSLVGLARTILRDTSAAEDVVQEVFVRLWDEPERFDASRGTVPGMLRNWVRSRALDAARRAGARQRAGERALERMKKVLEPITRDDKTGLENALGELPGDQRALLERMYFKGQTQAEIAKQTGIALGTVKSRIRLGMERLRNQFQAASGGDERDLPALRGLGKRPTTD
ncbi:MAG: sigma-70 family RNA polymerase sigma factor [Planctomycetes bacterium]|nr:sigma-70 family RNA polymerase sigma factor [Planctomycetota bacterium]